MKNELLGWMTYSWIALPTVMYGGYALLQLLSRKEVVSEFRRTWFRAGHAHAGVLLLMSLLYYEFIERTSLPGTMKHLGCGILVAGILSQSGGFFIHMMRGEPGGGSIGTTANYDRWRGRDLWRHIHWLDGRDSRCRLASLSRHQARYVVDPGQLLREADV